MKELLWQDGHLLYMVDLLPITIVDVFKKMLTPIIKLKQNDGENPAKIQHHTLTSFTPKKIHKYSKFFFDHP